MDDVKIRDVIQVDIDGQAYDAHVNNIKDGEAELYIPSFPLPSRQFVNVSANELRQMRIIPNNGGQADSKTSEKSTRK